MSDDGDDIQDERRSTSLGEEVNRLLQGSAHRISTQCQVFLGYGKS